eukprot:CAMPEP_0182460980 /NCGR_PEP_ID=MMETSP1319-20130603/5685_1 /TAXON_ID=172717 /ORGANISM="Bolidomonas pacifica, Strain RCC208" /LENGTH=75 /DNA_ID=CAMNT_0024660177 /DNA_START=131 /DNA_END=358 /DNA_ORIENTATION=-
MKNPLSSGLPLSGRLASWFVAISGAALWHYWESPSKLEAFGEEERRRWNSDAKAKGGKGKGRHDATTKDHPTTGS